MVNIEFGGEENSFFNILNSEFTIHPFHNSTFQLHNLSRMQELADPAMSLNRARETWQKHGRSDSGFNTSNYLPPDNQQPIEHVHQDKKCDD